MGLSVSCALADDNCAATTDDTSLLHTRKPAGGKLATHRQSPEWESELECSNMASCKQDLRNKGNKAFEAREVEAGQALLAETDIHELFHDMCMARVKDFDIHLREDVLDFFVTVSKAMDMWDKINHKCQTCVSLVSASKHRWTPGVTRPEDACNGKTPDEVLDVMSRISEDSFDEIHMRELLEDVM